MTGRVPGHNVVGPAVFAILLAPGREQLLLVLQAIFESGGHLSLEGLTTRLDE